jgi:hypothetical protein
MRIPGNGLASRLDSRRRRLLAIVALCVLLICVTVGVAAWIDAVTSSPGHNFSDRMAEDSVIITGGTLALALIAAVVAVMAFAAATGLPDLKLRVDFPFSWPNKPVFETQVNNAGRTVAREYKQTAGTISLRNCSAYSARNPAVIIRLNGMAFDNASMCKEWMTTRFASTVGAVEIQWDGGSTYSIHGHSTRQLPALDLLHVHEVAVWGNPSFTFELLADGYRRVVSLPVKFVEARESQSPQDGAKLDWL